MINNPDIKLVAINSILKDQRCRSKYYKQKENIYSIKKGLFSSIFAKNKYRYICFLSEGLKNKYKLKLPNISYKVFQIMIVIIIDPIITSIKDKSNYASTKYYSDLKMLTSLLNHLHYYIKSESYFLNRLSRVHPGRFLKLSIVKYSISNLFN